MTDRELLRLHLQAVWGLTLPALDEASHELLLTEPPPPWSFYLAAFAQERFILWRPDVEPEQRLRLEAQARHDDVAWNPALRMRREVVFRSPAISSQQQVQVQQQARILEPEDTDLINAFEAESAAYFLDPRAAPCIGIIIDGRLVSIAHSSRQTPAAYELGINTLPDARRHGYARTATILWTALVQQQGLVPIYSAFAENTASVQLAQSIGYEPRIHGVYGPMPEKSE
jgi:RimJ/RimL family protein N-acetyltransferase